MSNLCIVGDVLVDVSLKTKNTPLKMRLGGIIHCARAMWAMGEKYSVAYFAPIYLRPHIEEYLKNFGEPETLHLGEVETCPYIMLVGEPKEIGNQEYDFLLRDDVNIKYLDLNLQKLGQYKKFLLVSGNYELKKIYRYFPNDASLSIDIANNTNDLKGLKNIFFDNIFISTSSDIFQNLYNRSEDFKIDDFFEAFRSFTKRLVLKENRGGSRAIDFNSESVFKIDSQTRTISHSIGVGDVYNTSYLIADCEGIEEKLSFASFVAMEYASTTNPDDFKKMVARLMLKPCELKNLKGVSLAWEERKKINIYIAAPDFDYVDTRLIDRIEGSLKYHNFCCHRPVKLNGQMGTNATSDRKKFLFQKDMELLKKCNIVLGILLFNDPGTLIEIGIAAERGLPTIVYDPHEIAQNCMLTQLPDLVSSDPDEIISEIFIQSQNLNL